MDVLLFIRHCETRSERESEEDPVRFQKEKEEEKPEETTQVEIRTEGGASIDNHDKFAGQEEKPERKIVHRRGSSRVDEFDEFYMKNIHAEFEEVTGKEDIICAGGSTTEPDETDDPRNKQNKSRFRFI